MILYIHGFGSSGHGGKAILFKEYFKEDIIMPSLSYVPTLAIHTLEQIIMMCQAKGEKVSLVGSSLGGYYSIYLAHKYNFKAVLINPAIYPYETLDKIGMAMNYFDGSSFEVTKEHIQMLHQYDVQTIQEQSNFMVLLQKDDEVLDYNQAVQKMPKANLYVEEAGNHTFEGIERYFERIQQFFN